MGKYGPGKRRVMRSFKLDKISLVDVPAMKGADAVLLKRDGDAPVAQALEKARFAVMTSSTKGHAHLLYAYSSEAPLVAGDTSYAKVSGSAATAVR